MSDKLLNEPLQPGILRDCPECRKLFALEFVSKRESDQQGTIRTYRCKKCGSELSFAEHHPPNAI